MRANNYVEFLQKKYGVEFILDKSHSSETIEADAIYGLKVFMGSQDGKILGETELSENLNELWKDIQSFKDSIKPYESFQIKTHEDALNSRFHLRVFADQDIPDSTITKKLKANIPDTIQLRIYRIHEVLEDNDGIEKRNDILKGKVLTTLANNA